MTAILPPNSFKPTFEPYEMPVENTIDPQLEAAVDSFYSNASVRVDLMIAHLQMGIEQKKDDEIRKAIAENTELKGQTRTLTEFLKHVELALSDNANTKTINLADQSELISQAGQIVDHPLLKNKTEWSREEAETLCKVVPRHSELLMNQINDKMRDINHLVEDRHELLAIFRDLLKMIREMHDVFIRNQRA